MPSSAKRIKRKLKEKYSGRASTKVLVDITSNGMIKLDLKAYLKTNPKLFEDKTALENAIRNELRYVSLNTLIKELHEPRLKAYPFKGKQITVTTF